MDNRHGMQYPHVRALRLCLACGGPKHVGLLVCWECHNEFSMRYDCGYGPVMDRTIDKAEEAGSRERD